MSNAFTVTYVIEGYEMNVGHILFATWSLLMLGVAGLMVYQFYTNFRITHGTFWQRLLGAAESSVTLLWARFTLVVTAVVNGLVWFCDVINAPGVAAAINQYVDAKTVAVVMIAVAIITELARRRTLGNT